MSQSELVELLREAVAREMQVSIQYMWQHVLWRYPIDTNVRSELKRIAIVEMKHAEKIAERLIELGHTPPTDPSPVCIGASPEEIADINIDAEQGAIQLYTRILDLARQLNDYKTHELFQQVLKEEEEHLRFFQQLKARATAQQ